MTLRWRRCGIRSWPTAALYRSLPPRSTRSLRTTRLKVPLYGEADAGRIWNRTLVRQLTQVQKFQQSQFDPCYFWKHLSDGTRLDIVMYVDDGYAVDATSKAAEAELKQLNDAFKLTLKPAAFFLGNNVTVHDGAQGGAP